MSIVISYSELIKFDECPRQYYYRYILGLQPIAETLPLATGKKGHKMLQNFYLAIAQGKTPEEARKIVTKEAAKYLILDESVAKSWVLVDNFMQSYTPGKKSSLLIEQRFLVPASRFSKDPIFDDVYIGFTPDLVTERMGGFCDIEDYKFVGKAWSADKIEKHQQLKLYEIFLKEMGYNISRTILRFFNTATGSITEQPFGVDPVERSTILEEFLIGVENVVRFRQLDPEIRVRRSRRVLNTNTCQFCSFKYPCGLERKGKDASNTLKTEFVKSDYDYTQ